jgi:hypothetical protein
MNIWLYHINPKNRSGHTYGWDVKRPRTLLGSSDRTWPAGVMFNKVQPDDMICVYTKNIAPLSDGVYTVGVIRRTKLKKGHWFSWAIDRERSARLIVSPIPKTVVLGVFGRGYGQPMQRLPERHHRSWLSRLGRGSEVFEDTPVIKVHSSPPKNVLRTPPGDPYVSREHGIKGEHHVLRFLKRRFPLKRGYRVEHVSARNSAADHDIAVSKGRALVHVVEVKTRVGKPNEPVIISERELRRRRQSDGKHLIFVVYLGDKSEIHSTLEIGRKDTFRLAPRQHWLYPGVL